MRYTGINIILYQILGKIRESQTRDLISWYFGFEIFRGYNILRKWSKIAQLSTREI